MAEAHRSGERRALAVARVSGCRACVLDLHAVTMAEAHRSGEPRALVVVLD